MITDRFTAKGNHVLTSTPKWGAERGTIASLYTRLDCTDPCRDSTIGGMTEITGIIGTVGTAGMAGIEVFISVASSTKKSKVKTKTPLIRKLNLKRTSPPVPRDTVL
jgi:hypothetical protein